VNRWVLVFVGDDGSISVVGAARGIPYRTADAANEARDLFPPDDVAEIYTRSIIGENDARMTS
jgi:hypothetical protein